MGTVSLVGPFSDTYQLFGGTGGAGLSGADGGPGGLAAATNVVTFTNPPAGGDLLLSSIIVGGPGGASAGGLPGAGGHALNSISFDVDSLPNNKSSDPTYIASATGGAGGSALTLGPAAPGGDATISASFTSSLNNLNVILNSQGGIGGNAMGIGAAGNGGAATFGTTLLHAGTAAVIISMTARGGAGGNDLMPGGSAAGGLGATVLLNNAADVSGGFIQWSQRAIGGDAGAVQTGPAASAGSAASLLAFSGTAYLVGLVASATGGNGAARSATTGIAGDGASATAASHTSFDAMTPPYTLPFGLASASAFGGNGGNGTGGAWGGNGGSAVADFASNLNSPAPAFLHFDLASGTAQGGAGGSVINGNHSRGGDGGNAVSSYVLSVTGRASLMNVVSTAKGGNGGSILSGTGDGGNGGNAAITNFMLTVPSSSQVKATGLIVTGGDGGVANGIGHRGGDGGVATVPPLLVGTNSRSISDIGYVMTGGSGGNGSNGASGGNGRDASANVIFPSPPVLFQAELNIAGGNGGRSDGAIPGRAGNATAIASGNAAANATGGAGGDATGGPNATDGGSATAINLSGSGSATATGGRGGNATGGGNAGRGGDATAIGVNAIAFGGPAGQATGGGLSGLIGAGNASATATMSPTYGFQIAAMANGSSGTSQSTLSWVHSTDGPLQVTALQAHSQGPATTTGTPTLANVGTYYLSLPQDPYQLPAPNQNAAYARLYLRPGGTPSILQTSNPVHDDLNVDGSGLGPRSDLLLAVGRLATLSTGSPTIPDTYTSTISETIDLAQLATKQHLIVGLYNPTVTRSGFDSLRFRIFDEGNALVDQTFADPTAALSYFNTQALDLGAIDAGVTGPLDLVFQLDVTARAGDGFSLDLIAANATPGAGVPEPTTSVLAALAPLLVLRRRTRRRPFPLPRYSGGG
jgi:hypothetical protein